ncbi:hypothetical protein Hgul01_05289 [Herpetosiphon gulosus]|uniref:Uncharacterized protein n=1 Tax=Herpetosiphon gulosus TaxID=1973496 RepID=A0ABP9X7U6_9CHLR
MTCKQPDAVTNHEGDSPFQQAMKLAGTACLIGINLEGEAKQRLARYLKTLGVMLAQTEDEGIEVGIEKEGK